MASMLISDTSNFFVEGGLSDFTGNLIIEKLSSLKEAQIFTDDNLHVVARVYDQCP